MAPAEGLREERAGQGDASRGRRDHQSMAAPAAAPRSPPRPCSSALGGPSRHLLNPRPRRPRPRRRRRRPEEQDPPLPLRSQLSPGAPWVCSAPEEEATASPPPPTQHGVSRGCRT
nr:vegetative cell wall protein gp1-like [Equus asinus]